MSEAGDGAELSEYEHVNKKSRSEVSQEDETHGKEPPQVEIIGTAQLKAQEVLKRREALLEDSTMKLQRIYEVCMTQLNEMAGQRSAECEALLNSLHSVYVENYELANHLDFIRRSTLALFSVISQESPDGSIA